MPEAAEVSVAAGQLGTVAAGRILDELTVTHPRTVRSIEAGELDRFVGRRIAAVTRHGKWLLVTFEGVPAALGVHLRMSGQLLARAAGDQPRDRHVHARLRLGSRPAAPSPSPVELDVPAGPREAPGTTPAAFDVWFRDPRTFGELRVLASGAPVAADLFDPAVDGDVLARAARRRRVGVKAVLLDQARTVAGIGSYLGDEALHRAGIAPVRPADTLAAGAWQRVIDATRAVVTESAAAGGVTLADEGWVDLWGRPGRHGETLAVHARATCRTCGSATRRAVVGGRGTRWCPSCQDARRRR